MAILIKSNSYVVPKPASLNMRGIQTDEYGTVFGGHKAIVDPVQSGLTDAPVALDQIENLIIGGSNGSVDRPMLDDVSSNKGFSFSSPDGDNELIHLPSEFNLLNYGEKPSAVISLWVTHRSISAAYNGIAMCAYQTGAYSQWALYDNINAAAVIISLNGTLFPTQGVPSLNVPHLYTMRVEKIDETTMRMSAWIDSNSIGSETVAYPLKNPDDSPASGAEIPRLGGGNGYSTGFDGIVHRAQTFEIDPATFDAEQWIADEIANNASRFVLP